MARPVKYATAQEAAEQNLYSKMGGANWGLTLSEFIELVSDKCDLCGRPPQEKITTCRKDGTYELKWHYLKKDVDGKPRPLCKACRLMLMHFDLKPLLSHCARIMARRKWGVTNRWFYQSLE